MKMTRKIIPAIVMLLVSAIMLSTASFAWFASSTTVDATGMSVTAQSAAKFIEITNADKASYSSSATAKTASAVVDLVHAKIDGGNKKTVTWYVGTSADPDNKGTTDTSKSFTLDADGKADVNGDSAKESLALVNTFWVRMSSGSTTDLAKLKIQSVTVSGTGDKLNKALRVLVVGPDGSQLWTNTSGTMALATGANCADYFMATVTKTEAEFTVYVYYDGDDAVSTTNNALTLNGLSVSIKFAAEMPSGS